MFVQFLDLRIIKLTVVIFELPLALRNLKLETCRWIRYNQYCCVNVIILINIKITLSRKKVVDGYHFARPEVPMNYK